MNSRLNEYAMSEPFRRISKQAALFAAGLLILAANSLGQAPDKTKEQESQKSAEKSAESPNAAQFELLETSYRFELDGDSRKEVRALVKINSELGVRQFARLNFEYNRSFQSVEIPLVHIAHANGGSYDILPGAITDNANPAVVDFPAYEDVRVKSVRILGLGPGDSLEYRVVTRTTKSPLAPDFWLDHSFDRSGVVTSENFQLDLPASKFHKQSPTPDGTEPHSNFRDVVSGVEARHGIEPTSVEFIGEGKEARILMRWSVRRPRGTTEEASLPDVSATTTASTMSFSDRFVAIFYPQKKESVETLREQLGKLVGPTDTSDSKLRKIYDFVSKQIRTVELPLGSTGFFIRDPADTLRSGYATAEDKIVLLEALCEAAHLPLPEVLLVSGHSDSPVVRENPFSYEHILVSATYEKHPIVMDPSVEVAPIGLFPASLREKPGLRLYFSDSHATVLSFEKLVYELPFPARQKVFAESTITSNGTLRAKISYNLRGDNELLLRVAFHKSPKEKQQEIAQYLALSDGFRGKVTSVKTSDPYDTDKPFEVAYELTQEKFVDWAKKPVRIPALLPLPGLPETPKKTTPGAKIELGPPLDIELSGTLRLPVGVTGQAPPGTNVKRDYAAFSSEYSVKGNLVHFARHLNFLARDISSDRALDLGAFVHAVESDQSQLFILEKPEASSTAKPK